MPLKDAIIPNDACLTCHWTVILSRVWRSGVASKPFPIFCATSALVANLRFKKLSPGSQGDSGEPGRQSADKVKVPAVQIH